jgi:putative Mg2+ transporter-C (MgtC) family protein
MDIIIEELSSGLPDARQLVRVLLRLTVALLLGAVVGYQRERIGKPAGLRTHMLVAAGTALFVLAAQEADMGPDALSRIIQGVATGIGFIGAGAILKLYEERDIQGLTTAAGIWMTAAVGVGVGLGRLGAALVSTALTWIVLALLGGYEHLINKRIFEDQSRGETEGQHNSRLTLL